VWMPPGATVRRCATNCDGRTVKVITGAEDVDYSTETGGVCAIADTTVNAWGVHIRTDVTLTEHDDCFVVAGPAGFGESYDGAATDGDLLATLLGLGGDDVLCGSAYSDYGFFGMLSDVTPIDVITRGPCHALHRFPKPCSHRW